MDDFVVLGKDKSELWAVLGRIEQFLTERLQLHLNPQRVAILPLTRGVDFLGYVVYPGGYKRVRRRNVVHVRHRLRALQEGHARGEVSLVQAQSSIASWVGLAQHASAFRLSRQLFVEHDVRNIGKRLLVKSVGG